MRRCRPCLWLRPRQELRRGDDRNAVERMEREQIQIAGDDGLGPAGERHIQKLVVLRVAAGVEVVVDGHHAGHASEEGDEALPLLVRQVGVEASNRNRPAPWNAGLVAIISGPNGRIVALNPGGPTR